MFYYCECCANIKNVNAKGNQILRCEVCGRDLRKVPQEYLMNGGSFFKSQDERKRLIKTIEQGEEYRADISGSKEQILKEKEAAKKEELTKRNEKLKEQQQQFQLQCPVCGKSNLTKISNVGKIAKVSVFGLLGTGDLGKKWKCNICGTKF